MCGIAGFFGSFQPELLDRMNAIQAHRGPDFGTTFYLQNSLIGLAHRRLSILDPRPVANQPLKKNHAVLCFNGEIYNFRELKQDLEQDGFQFLSNGDSEVFLSLYLRDGVKAFEKINGMFAAAIWDSQKQCLLIARDPLGLKPLYYTETKQGFLFASEMKALLQESSVERQINHDAVISHLKYLWSPAPDTLLKNVMKLEPGELMTVKDSRIVSKRKFYHLPYDQPVLNITEQEALEETRRLVRQATKRQLVSDVPLGAFLSGGLDSTSLCAMACQEGMQNLPCFTIAFEGDEFQAEGTTDDLPFAKQAASHLGLKLSVVNASPQVCDLLEKMIYHLDEPQADPAPLNVFLICEQARKQGIKVLLSGAGGDDIFSGYRRHQALQWDSLWNVMPQPMRQLIAKSSHLLPQNQVILRRIRKALRSVDLNRSERLVSYFHWSSPDWIQSVCGQQLQETLQKPAPDSLLNALGELAPSTPPLNQMLYLDTRFFLADHNLHYTDKMSMASGVEVRSPLLDLDLVNFCARLPVKLKQKKGIGKYLFKKSMQAYLPESLIYRPKTGFGMPLRHWLQNDLKPLFEETLSEQALQRNQLFDSQGVQHLLKLTKQGRVDGTYTLFAMLCIEIWSRQFL